MLESLTIESFQPLAGSVFRIAGDDSSEIPLTLLSVTPLGSPDVGRRKTAFSLIFRGPRVPALAQQIYNLHHPQLGTLGIFIVPIQPDAEGQLYEAIFS